MIDILEKATIQDLGFAKALGIDESEVERISLFQMKNEMHNKAFDMRYNKQIISQEEANILNKRLEEIICKLTEFEYDIMEDYIIDFNSFVVSNEYYNKFCW